MKITLESTSKLVTFEVDRGQVPARIWEGVTEDGTPVHAYITRICPSIPEPLPEAIAAEFARALAEQKPPSAVVRAIPMRMIL